MAETNGKNGNGITKFLKSFLDFIEKEISMVVFIIFLLLSLGAFFGYYIALRGLTPLWLFAPLTIGIVAYYNRGFALVILILIVLGFFIL